MGCTAELSTSINIVRKIKDKNGNYMNIDLQDTRKQGEVNHPNKESNNVENEEENNYYNYNLDELIFDNFFLFSLKL